MTSWIMRAILFVLLAAGLCGCATPAATGGEAASDPVGEAISQPLRDLSLIRDRLPEAVIRAAAEPYLMPTDCGAARTELTELDAALGPDVDATAATDGLGEHIVSEAIRSAAGLPFRGAVREITGAARRDRAAARAVLAATARRGFLKGWLTRCEAPTTPAA
jgi:hypothetical protein